MGSILYRPQGVNNTSFKISANFSFVYPQVSKICTETEKKSLVLICHNDADIFNN